MQGISFHQMFRNLLQHKDNISRETFLLQIQLRFIYFPLHALLQFIETDQLQNYYMII